MDRRGLSIGDQSATRTTDDASHLPSPIEDAEGRVIMRLGAAAPHGMTGSLQYDWRHCPVALSDPTDSTSAVLPRRALGPQRMSGCGCSTRRRP